MYFVVVITYEALPFDEFVAKVAPEVGIKTGVVMLPPFGALHLIKPGILCTNPKLSVINTVPKISFP